MKIKVANEIYIVIAKTLNEDQKERLLCRMRDKLTRKWENEELDTLAALAIQLEVEEEELADWRENMKKIHEKEKSSKKN